MQFSALSRRRGIGMSANPITDLDLEAFCRRRLMRLSSWHKELIFRLDDAVLDVWADNLRANSKGGDREIPVSDAKGIKGLFRGLAAARKGRSA